MRTLLAVVAMLLLLPLSAAEPLLLLDDPSGDITTEAGPVQHGVPDPVNHVDLAALTVLEDQDFFHFEVQFHQAPAAAINYNELDFYMEHAGQAYRIDLHVDSPAGAELHRMDPLTGQSSLVGTLDADLSDWIVKKVMVPRDLLLGVDGAPPFPGRVLHEFSAEAASWRVQVTGDDDYNFGAKDRMPDEGTDGSYEVQQGLHSIGHARLYSPAPARASNGAANTFIFPVVAGHEGNASATYDLKVTDQPEGWDVRLPSSTFRLEPAQQFRFPVMATLPSAHIHDSKETIRLVLKEVGGDSEAILDLTVVFHSIPQPAGHHPVVYLHSRAGSSAASAVLPAGDFLYMNALPNDPDDEEVAVAGTAKQVGATSYSWSIPLHPSLQMGLDFDLSQNGTLVLPLAADAPIQGAELSAALTWKHGSDERVLATMKSAPFDLGPAVGTQSLEMEWSPQADLVPFQGLASLSLDVELETGRPVTFTAPEAPKILPGGSLALPLLEYEDPIDPEFLKTRDVKLRVLGAAEKGVKPGNTATFDVELSSQPGAPSSFRIDVTGLNAKWATAPDRVEVTPGQAHTFQVAVEAPPNTHSETADLVLAAVPEGTGETALLRLKAIVDDGAEAPDESHVSARGTADAQKSTPAIAPLVVLVLATALALRRRK